MTRLGAATRNSAFAYRRISLWTAPRTTKLRRLPRPTLPLSRIAWSLLDRLGRDALNVDTTAATLAQRSIKVHCLARGGVDVTSSAGRMIMRVVAAMAQIFRSTRLLT